MKVADGEKGETVKQLSILLLYDYEGNPKLVSSYLRPQSDVDLKCKPDATF